MTWTFETRRTSIPTSRSVSFRWRFDDTMNCCILNSVAVYLEFIIKYSKSSHTQSYLIVKIVWILIVVLSLAWKYSQVKKIYKRQFFPKYITISNGQMDSSEFYTIFQFLSLERAVIEINTRTFEIFKYSSIKACHNKVWDTPKYFQVQFCWSISRFSVLFENFRLFYPDISRKCDCKMSTKRVRAEKCYHF